MYMSTKESKNPQVGQSLYIPAFPNPKTRSMCLVVFAWSSWKSMLMKERKEKKWVKAGVVFFVCFSPGKKKEERVGCWIWTFRRSMRASKSSACQSEAGRLKGCLSRYCAWERFAVVGLRKRGVKGRIVCSRLPCRYANRLRLCRLPGLFSPLMNNPRRKKKDVSN